MKSAIQILDVAGKLVAFLPLGIEAGKAILDAIAAGRGDVDIKVSLADAEAIDAATLERIWALRARLAAEQQPSASPDL